MRATGEQPEHDTSFDFANVRHPERLVPDWAAPQRLSRLPWPAAEDSAGRLLWLIREGSIAQPWIPSPSEQDEAWLAVWGEHMDKMRTNREYYAAVGNSFDGRQR